jgi:hypothetical protein
VLTIHQLAFGLNVANKYLGGITIFAWGIELKNWELQRLMRRGG